MSGTVAWTSSKDLHAFLQSRFPRSGIILKLVLDAGLKRIPRARHQEAIDSFKLALEERPPAAKGPVTNGFAKRPESVNELQADVQRRLGYLGADGALAAGALKAISALIPPDSFGEFVKDAKMYLPTGQLEEPLVESRAV